MGFIESERPRECVNFAIIWRSADVLNLFILQRRAYA